MKQFKTLLFGLLVAGTCNAWGMFIPSDSDSDTEEVETSTTNSSWLDFVWKNTATQDPNKQRLENNSTPSTSNGVKAPHRKQNNSGFAFSHNGYTFSSNADQKAAHAIIEQLKIQRASNKRLPLFFLVGNDISKNESCVRAMAQEADCTPLAINCENYTLTQLNNLLNTVPAEKPVLLIVRNFEHSSDELKERILSLTTNISLEDSTRSITVAYNSIDLNEVVSFATNNDIPNFSDELIIELGNRQSIKKYISQSPKSLSELVLDRTSLKHALLRIKELKSKAVEERIRPFLVLGPDGVGKKTFIKTIAQVSNYDFSDKNIFELFNQAKNNQTENFVELLKKTSKRTICCLEGLEQLYDKTNRTFSQKTYNQLWNTLKGVNNVNPHIIFALTGLSAKHIDPNTYTKLHSRKIILPRPLTQERTKLFKRFLKLLNWTITPAVINDLVQKTVNWTPRELEAIVDGAVENSPHEPQSNRLLDSHVDLAKALGKSNRILTTLTLSDLYLHQATKDDINHVINIVKNWKGEITPERSLLLYGPYGTAKTTIAEIIAREAGAYFEKKQAARFVEKYVGTGGERIEAAFEELKNIDTPVVFLIDELEGLCPSQDEASQGKGTDEYTKAAQVLWGLMDDFKKLYPHIFVIAACNNYEKIHPRIHQTFKETLELRVPTQQERAAIIIKQAPLFNKTITPALARRLAQQTNGWSGRELLDLMQKLHDRSLGIVAITPEVAEIARAKIQARKDGKQRYEDRARQKRIDRHEESAVAHDNVSKRNQFYRILEAININKLNMHLTAQRRAVEGWGAIGRQLLYYLPGFGGGELDDPQLVNEDLIRDLLLEAWGLPNGN